MKNTTFLLLLILSFHFTNAQSISPSINAEVCPGIEITFNASLPAQDILIVEGWANFVAPTVTQGIYDEVPGVNGAIAFKFKGIFLDQNVRQTFRVSYKNLTNGGTSTWEFVFRRVKSLFNPSGFSQIVLTSGTQIPAVVEQMSDRKYSYFVFKRDLRKSF